jgi:two-component system, NarL family, sensor histidine kinase BarA
MKLSIRSTALLMILAPTLVSALVLSAWFTGQRVGDARAELESRGEREARYLADASALALLVADSETLQRLAASNLRGEGAAAAVLFLDAAGAVLAAAGESWELGMARQCWLRAIDCSGGEQRYLFEREVRAGNAGETSGAFAASAATVDAPGELIGRVVLSFDPRGLAEIQRAMLINSGLITMAALFIAALLAQLFARRLSLPMQRLSSVVARIRAGELGARTHPAGTGELRELEDGVNAMADKVEAASAELNRRVDEATAELSHALIEGEQRNRELDQALARAADASRAKDLFLARMSHELRTPLTTVTGYARLMQRSSSAEQRADFYRTLEQASRILQATVDDILIFVKLESGSLHLERREFDLESCIEDAVMMQAPAACAKALDLVCHSSEGLPLRVSGDSLRLSQVLSNLISNAIKFTRDGHVLVRAQTLSRDNDTARIAVEVSDTGIGIAPESIPQLFQPFAQADESMTRRFGGSGLGLSISSGIVHALGGSISLRSAPDAGTRVRVELPLLLESGEGDAGADSGPLLRGTRIAVLAHARSLHLPVVVDYLERCEASVTWYEHALAPRQPVDRHTADLLLTLEDIGHESSAHWLDSSLPTLRLRPVEVLLHPEQHYLGDSVPLPLRRRELIAACLRRLQGVPSAVLQRAETPLSERRRLDISCLVVEDNDLNRRMIAAQLHDAGIDVLEAGGGSEALALLQTDPVDVVLLDVHMPDMDGITLARQLLRLYAHLPVYALTANVIGSEEQALAAAGVRAVLYKPIDERRLLEVLTQHGSESCNWRMQASAGIDGAEVLAEMSRLADALHLLMERKETATAIEVAHQLLGVARMFTRGSLRHRCLELEMALRERDGERAAQIFARIRAALLTQGA